VLIISICLIFLQKIFVFLWMAVRWFYISRSEMHENNFEKFKMSFTRILEKLEGPMKQIIIIGRYHTQPIEVYVWFHCEKIKMI